MRALFVSLLFALAAAALGAEKTDDGNAAEHAGSAAESSPSAATGTDLPEQPAAVEASKRDDNFVPTDQLRYDQEVDYPTDI